MTSGFDELQRALPKRYRLERQLKRGGMGYIYLAREAHPERRVAIKVLDPAVTLRLGHERFLREVSLLSNLTHSHIVPVFAAGDAEGLLYYVMPFIDGETVGERIARLGKLTPGTALRLAHEVADALAYAHHQNIVHRDIKPSNILLHDEHALVTDFGIARAIRVAESEPITEAGVTLGTPAYMSPEQITGESEIDGRSDVYSLGCVLYEMLAGEPPFRGADSRTIMIKHVTDRPVPIEQKCDVPEAVAKLVDKAMAKAPADRFQSAKEFNHSILLQGDPRTSWSGSLDFVRRPRRLRRRLALIATAVGVVALGAALAVWRGGSGSNLPFANWLDSIAVLPAPMSDPQLDHIGHTIAELVVGRLTGLGTVKVPSVHAAEPLLDSALLDVELARRLGVRHVILVAPFGDSVAVRHYDAVAARTRWRQAWPVSAETESEERAVASRILSMLSQHVPAVVGEEDIAFSALSPGHEPYSMGAHWLQRRTPDGLRRAIAGFEQAIALDSSYAAAHANLASSLSLALFYRYDVHLDEYAIAAKAVRHAEEAIRLDPSDYKGWAARGYIGALAGAAIDDVERDLVRAMELNPSGPNAHGWVARVWAARGRYQEALDRALKAVHLEPAGASRRVGVAVWAFQLGDYETAILHGDTAAAIEPEIAVARAVAARAHLLAGRPGACLDYDLGPYRVLRAMCLAAMGEERRADEIVAAVRSRIARGERTDTAYTLLIPIEELAVYYAFIKGDAAQALEWARRAFAISPVGIDEWVIKSALFRRLERNTQFTDEIDRLRKDRWSRVTRLAAPVPAGPRGAP